MATRARTSRSGSSAESRRVFEIARDAGITSRELQELIQKWRLKLDVKNHMSVIPADRVDDIVARLAKAGLGAAPAKAAPKKAAPKKAAPAKAAPAKAEAAKPAAKKAAAKAAPAEEKPAAKKKAAPRKKAAAAPAEVVAEEKAAPKKKAAPRKKAAAKADAAPADAAPAEKPAAKKAAPRRKAAAKADAAPADAAPAEKPAPKKKAAPRSSEEDAAAAERRKEREAELAERQKEREAELAEAMKEGLATGRTWLQDTLKGMGYERPKVAGNIAGDTLEFDISGKGIDDILEQRNAAARTDLVESLQYLLSRVVSGKVSINVAIDVAGFRRGRQAQLLGAAQSVAKFVKASGRTLRFAGMNAFDRRSFHNALGAEEGVRTESDGRGRLRRLHAWAVGGKSDRRRDEPKEG